jgi:aspartyl-tRNA(Asn)/glutamyl-tRNA(Gln) amidotransferase subunit B
MRCDVNVSVRREGSSEFGARCEIKNLNSVRFVAKAIEYEVARHIRLLESGGRVAQETRGFDITCGETYRLRSKEEEVDYRYFPDPDLPQLVVSQQLVDQIKSQLPELPDDKRKRLIESYAIGRDEATILVHERGAADFFERVVQLRSDAVQAALWYVLTAAAQAHDIVGTLVLIACCAGSVTS